MTNLRIGTGYDVHQLKNNLPFLLGGVEVAHNKGVVAHSDGDIVFHALSDALLGAAALGDIGHFFPDTDPAYENMDSSIILSSVLAELSTLSYEIVNVDITIVLERPKLQSIIPVIKNSVAKHLKAQLNQVNIKATTSEKMGFVGNEEGVVCYASVLIEKI
tara:strand:+ start:163 stop:645 length:483 start_codon:yes stop_codon:yes gene_type:complete